MQLIVAHICINHGYDAPEIKNSIVDSIVTLCAKVDWTLRTQVNGKDLDSISKFIVSKTDDVAPLRAFIIDMVSVINEKLLKRRQMETVNDIFDYFT